MPARHHAARTALCALALAAAARADRASYPPPPPFLSNVFGDHAVLQRDAPALVYGFAAPGAVVNTTMAQGGGSGASFALQTVATGDGVWRQQLPAQPASRVDGADAWAFSFASDAGDAAAMADVLFGDVHMCSGQSHVHPDPSVWPHNRNRPRAPNLQSSILGKILPPQ